MKKINFMLVAVMLLTVFFVGSLTNSNVLYAQDNGVVTVQSKKLFDDTVSDLRKLISKNGMMVLAEVNHGKILSMTGLEVNGIALFVGNPQIGKKLFTANRGTGLAVPIRVNIYEGTDGKTYVNYVKPSSQFASFESKEIGMIGKMLDKKLAMLTGMISK
ncbi:MAG: hypothetical protein COW08_02550 [Ignavibacteriales bacterium CG12_big_fil_rev_8_21_14_0_65_30_8]|nr:MAG: hypothetical protein COW08_02550 [Ignavibacteriales bacterium CG12_big_fil_rev_8_21_14_0_65_30_8]